MRRILVLQEQAIPYVSRKCSLLLLIYFSLWGFWNLALMVDEDGCS